MQEYDRNDVLEMAEPLAIAEHTDRAERVANAIDEYEPHELPNPTDHLARLLKLSDGERAYVSSTAPFPCVAREWEMCNLVDAIYPTVEITSSNGDFTTNDDGHLFTQIQNTRNW